MDPTGLDLIRTVFAQAGFERGIGNTLGIQGTHADPGTVILAAEPNEDHYNPMGSVHGGYLSTMLDAAMALSVQTLLDSGTPYATTDLHVHFLRSLKRDVGGVTATGKVLDQTRSRAVAEAEIRDDAGTLYARATAGFAISRPMT